MRTNTLLTLYNKYVDPTTRTELYQRTLLPGQVEWENRKAANVNAQGGNTAADQATIYIPGSLGVKYLKPAAWKALSIKTGYWTLQVGDIVVKGEVDDTIHAATTDPVVAAFTPTNLKEKYDDVLVITSIDQRDAGSLYMRHWQLGAK
jgi:hypothetical protein